MDENAAKSQLIAFIGRHKLGVIATSSPAAVPEAALINIAVTPDFEIVFETTAATRKCGNLRDNPRVAMVIGWNDDQTLQIDGLVELLEGSNRDRLKAIFVDAFPNKASHEFWPGNDFYRVRPFWARFSNYTPPRKVEEFHFPENLPKPPGPRWWQVNPFRVREPRQRN